MKTACTQFCILSLKKFILLYFYREQIELQYLQEVF